MQQLEEDYYQILGVEEKASGDEIRKAYLKLAKKLHPDRFPNDAEKKAEAQAEFARVTRAHEVLGDPKQREEYDALRTLSKTRSGTGAAGGSSAQAPDPKASVETKEQWAAKHSQRAAEAVARKNFPDAETAIKEAIRLDPNKVKYHVQLAEIYLARGWRTLAQTELQTALRLDPKDAGAKQLELKLKAQAGKAAAAADKKSGGFLGGLFKKN